MLPLFHRHSRHHARTRAAEFQDYILRHWEVENCLHLEKDKEYDEDKHVLRGSVLDVVWTFLTGVAGAAVRLSRKGVRTPREIRERFNANHTALKETC